ncbi:hypothetical protein I4U23_017967 [Adineta vaga]|nr:hypothetical protein I4U23_017967 [Adineta vaga]
MTLINIFWVLSFEVTFVSSSHYRGSMITWRVINSTSDPLIVELFHRHTWSYTWYPCTDSQIAFGNHTIGTGYGSGNITCASSCPLNDSVLTSVATPCTAANLIENFATGEARYIFSVPLNKQFRVLFAAGDWFTLITGGNKWSVCTEINTYKRLNGRYNQAPIVTLLPIMRLRQNLTHFIKVNVADNDFDRYVCIWSNTSQECAGICRSLLSLPSSTYLNETSCVLRITPTIIGYYALAVTVLDFENASSTTPLSRVPIQFILRIWNSPIPCQLPPIYLGDAPADQCIFVEPGQSLVMFIRIRVQCPNATLDNVIGVYPAGFTQSTTFVDPFDPTIYIFKITYVANANQVGQNLFCFSGVDSIGNQGASTCLRFTVQIASESQNTLYILNATHFPIGLVPKTQSKWTILYPSGITFSRPNTKAFVRFKFLSTKTDFLTYDVVKQVSQVDYQLDRLVITSNAIFTAGEKFFISLDPGVFLPIASCLRDSMGITDTSFWPFEIASETSVTSTSTTTTQSSTSTARPNRTIPTIRTISSTVPSSTTKKTTIVFITTTNLVTTVKTIISSSSFPITGIIGIVIGSLITLGIVLLVIRFIRHHQTSAILKVRISQSQLIPSSEKEIPQQFKLATRTAVQATSNIENNNNRDIARLTTTVHKNLVSVVD